MLLFISFFLSKNIFFSDKNVLPLSEMNISRKTITAKFTQNFFELKETIMYDLEIMVDNEFIFCTLISDLKTLNLFDGIEERNCFNLCESLKSKYIAVRMLFTDIIEGYLEIGEYTVKILDELNLIIEEKQKFNLLFIKQFQYILAEEQRIELLLTCEIFKNISTFIDPKITRFKRIYQYIKNIFNILLFYTSNLYFIDLFALNIM